MARSSVRTGRGFVPIKTTTEAILHRTFRIHRWPHRFSLVPMSFDPKSMAHAVFAREATTSLRQSTSHPPEITIHQRPSLPFSLTEHLAHTTEHDSYSYTMARGISLDAQWPSTEERRLNLTNPTRLQIVHSPTKTTRKAASNRETCLATKIWTFPSPQRTALPKRARFIVHGDTPAQPVPNIITT